MKNKKLILLITLLISTFCLGVGTFAFFSRSVEGTLTGNVGNLFLVVNEADSLLSESFNIRLRRSESEDYIFPDDSGSFEINIDSTGSISDVEVTVAIERTNLPDNLKFYVDAGHTEEFTSGTYTIRKSDTMTKSLTLYWFWDGSIDDVNDTLFMNKTIEAKVNVSVKGIESSLPTLYETLALKPSTLDTDVNFSLLAADGNGHGLMKVSSTKNNTYPILYYRGIVMSNNVVYGGFCWLIVRTTETGGVKLIYNGEVNTDGSCNNYSGVGGMTPTACTSTSCGTYIQSSSFNSSYNAPVYSGYMFNNSTYKYTKATYATHLADNTVDTSSGRHTQNLTNSTIKGVIDAWYKTNIEGKDYEGLLEDTVWCNDRSITSTAHPLENFVNGTDTQFNYSAFTRLQEVTPVVPTLTCSREMDRFTVNSTNGNGDLDYPIGMLTIDELLMAGNTYYVDTAITTYLTVPDFWYYLMSPNGFVGGYVRLFYVLSGGLRNGGDVTYSGGVRPSISLGLSAKVNGGNGSFSSPYTISS